MGWPVKVNTDQSVKNLEFLPVFVKSLFPGLTAWCPVVNCPRTSRIIACAIERSRKRRARLCAGRAANTADGGQSIIIQAGTEARLTKTIVVAETIDEINARNASPEGTV